MLAQLQARWLKAHEAERSLAYKLQYEYGNTWSAPSGKRARYEAVSKRMDMAADAVFEWLDANSPRSWRTGVPMHWVLRSLTLADALTSGQLSVPTPVVYGGYPSDALRFAMAVAS